MNWFRSLSIVSFLLVLASGPPAGAGTQQYDASWIADSFGNDRIAATSGSPTSHAGTGASEFFSVFGIPQGVLCNPGQPRCPIASTPTVTMGGKARFNPLGGLTPKNVGGVPNCLPITASPFSATMRPGKGGTLTTGGSPVSAGKGGKLSDYAPRYRNPFFFTGGGAPKVTACTATTTASGAQATQVLTFNDTKRGKVMVGAPLTGLGHANTTTPMAGGGFTFGSAPTTETTRWNGMKDGFRRTTIGEFNNIFPYVYSYTYATFRNSIGSFGQNLGFFGTAAGTSVSIPYTVGGKQKANIVVKAGASKFGGTMALLGKITTKVCYFRNNGCSIGGINWRYEVIGTFGTKNTAQGTVTKGYVAKYTKAYFHTNLAQTSTVYLEGERFPWTTGTATVTAIGRGPHKTVAKRSGYDNRTSVSGKGQIQLVSPVLSHWLQSCCEFETGGVAVMRIEFLPEPSRWMMLVAGLSVLGVLYRSRGR